MTESGQVDDTLVVAPKGDIGSLDEARVGEECDQLLVRLSRQNAKHVLLDLDKVTYFGSKLLEWLIRVRRKLKESAGRLGICSPSATGLKVLKTAKFDSLLPIYSTLDEGLKAHRS